MDKRLTLPVLQQAGALSSVDVHLAKLASRLTEESRPEVHLAMALASQWPQRGHVCVDLKGLELEDLWESLEHAAVDTSDLALPELASWQAMLKESQAIGAPEEQTPFVLWQDRWLYLRRHWLYESSIARRLRLWLGEACSDSEMRGTEDQQDQAVALAPLHPFFILTGGPGTGKTTTVLRILESILASNPELAIGLAAPTGKAALRLQESLSAGNEAIPRTAQTLHRLLGYQRHKTTFRHHAGNPLPYELVIVDEASMIDLGLFAKLLDALKPEAKLIIVGDREQLPSVDAGAVFKGLCAPESPVPRVELTKNYRFAQDSGIGALAHAIRSGDGALAAEHLAPGEEATCRLEELPAPNALREALWHKLSDYLKTLSKIQDPEEAFACLDQFRILCAHRTGPYGAEAINESVNDLLISRLKHSRHQRWYLGRPILITENDYAAELFNGDTGLLLPWKGKLHAFFRSGHGEFRHLPPARLPAHESAYAMTVHKSQGSEFDEVLLVLTDQPSRILTRELLYTGVTRARQSVCLWSPMSTVQACIARPLQRTSGLKAWFDQWEAES